MCGQQPASGHCVLSPSSSRESPQQQAYVQEYRRRFNLDPLVKQVSREEEVLQHQGRTRATVRPATHIHNRESGCTLQ